MAAAPKIGGMKQPLSLVVLMLLASVMSLPSESASTVAPGESGAAAQPYAVSGAAQTAGISGRITDAAGQPAPGVRVTAVPAKGGAAVHGVSAPDGTYELGEMTEGVYFVDFDLLGFDITRRNHVRVTAKTTAHADAVLYVTGICDCVKVTPPQQLGPRWGQVLSASGHPLPHARLQLVRPQREFDYTDAEGRFVIHVPLDERVPLTVSESGFRPATQQVSGAITTAPLVFRMRPANGASLLDTERLPRPCC